MKGRYNVFLFLNTRSEYSINKEHILKMVRKLTIL